MLPLPEHLSSHPVVSVVHATQSLVLSVCFVDRCLSFCTFSFGHCVVCSSIFDIFKLFHLWGPSQSPTITIRGRRNNLSLEPTVHRDITFLTFAVTPHCNPLCSHMTGTKLFYTLVVWPLDCGGPKRQLAKPISDTDNSHRISTDFSLL
jgi:hypothetical protein